MSGIQRTEAAGHTETAHFAVEKPVFKPGREFILALTALCMLRLACTLDATSLSTGRDGIAGLPVRNRFPVAVNWAPAHGDVSA